MNRKQQEARKYRELIARRSFSLESRKLMQRIALRRRKSEDDGMDPEFEQKREKLIDDSDSMASKMEDALKTISSALEDYHTNQDDQFSSVMRNLGDAAEEVADILSSEGKDIKRLAEQLSRLEYGE